MIIANAFKELFSGATVVTNEIDGQKTRDIKFGYGSTEELTAWIVDQNKKSTPDKYPLVWYIITPYYETDGWFKNDVQLVLMTYSTLDAMNDWRNTFNYIGVLQPVWKVLEDRITISQKIQVYYTNADEKFKQFDDPNFGINPIGSDLKSGKSSKSASIDIVDCKIITFSMRMKVENCY